MSSGPTLGRPTRAGGWVGWLVATAVLLVSVATLLRADTPVRDVLAQAAYLALAVTLPGLVVHRALRGPRGSWLADLGLGTALGLALELGAWALYTSVGGQAHLWTWPLLTLPLLAPRVVRSRVLARPTGPGWGAWPAVGVGAAAIAWTVTTARDYMAQAALPPAGAQLYPDLVWHMGLVSEATRSIPLLTPQSVAEGTLRYHWFSDAHIAATTLVTGSPVPLTVLRLWVLPVGLLTIVLTAVLAQRVSGRAWAGGLAAWLVVPTLGYPFWPGVVAATNHMNPLSPSQLFSTPLALLLMVSLVDLVQARGRLPAGTVAVAVLAALACSGAKSSALPVVLGGIGAAFLAALVLRRARALLFGAGVLLSGLVLVAMAFVAGGDAGSGIQLFSAWSLSPVYRTIITAAPNLDTTVLDGLVRAPGVGPMLFVALALVAVLAYVRLLSGVAPFVQRALRTDLAAWLLGGASLSSFLPYLVIAHDGYSQIYFVFGAIPFGAALWAWSVAALVADSPARARVAGWTLALGAGATVVAGLALRDATAPADKAAMVDAIGEFVVAVAVVAGILLLVAVGALWARRRGHDAWMPLAACLVLAPIVGTGLLQVVTDRPMTPVVSQPHLVDQDLAAAWISANVPAEDVLATNDHCLGTNGLSCNSREWWVSGIGGRRVLIEGWQYLPPAAELGRYHDPDLYALNQAAFTDPGPATFGPLRELGVGWLVADSLEVPSVSPRLATEADEVFRSGEIAVYRLP